jgi:hypothetical protein
MSRVSIHTTNAAMQCGSSVSEKEQKEDSAHVFGGRQQLASRHDIYFLRSIAVKQRKEFVHEE